MTDDRDSIFRLSAATVILVVLSFAASLGLAETIPTQDPVEYRRVFVPADSPEAWPTGSERYLPVAIERFEELLDQARNRKLLTTNTARLSGAKYRAELVDGNVLTGTAEYEIELPEGQPRVAPLEPMNLAILSAYWQGNGGTPANWGSWKFPDAPRVWGILVPRSDSLLVEWQLRSQSAEDEPVEFEMQLPPEATQTLELLLPGDYEPVLTSAQRQSAQEAPNGKRLWRFQLASRGPHRLQLFQQGASTTTARHQLRVSRTSVNRLQKDGLEQTTEFRIEPSDTSSGELRCSLTGDIKIAKVTLEGEPIDWQVSESMVGKELVIRVPNTQKLQVLEVHALAPVQFDKPWHLPTIRPQGAGWTEGTSLLTISPALELCSLTAQSATVEHIVGLQSERAELEAYRVQEWSEQASLEIIVSRRLSKLEVTVATAANLGTNETTARLSAEISCRDQPVYQLFAKIAEGWSIESVKSDPASTLREWHVENDGAQAVLHLQLDHPIQPDVPFKIEFDARAQQSRALLPTTVNRLKILRFVNASFERQMVLLRNRRQGRMEFLRGLESARLAPEQLTSRERALLPTPIIGELIDVTDLADDQIVSLRRRRARYEAQIAADLKILPQSCVHHYEITCVSSGGPISEVAVRFDQPLPETAKWTLIGNEDGIGNRQLVMPEQENSASDEIATYLLKLPYAASEEVCLVIDYSMAAQESTAWNSISLPRSERWSGQVAVHGPVEGLQIDDSTWTPVGWEASVDADGNLPPLLGCYRLESNSTRRVRRTSPLVVRRSAGALTGNALVAWLAEFQSHQAADGAAIYSAAYFLENSGATEVEIVLPEQTTLQASWLERRQLAQPNPRAADRTYRFHLTEGQRYPTLALQYVSHGPALGRSTTIEPSLPKCSFPVQLSRWTLWTPEQFVPDDLVTGYSARRVPWRQRLFGPLARSVGQDAFRPLRAADWPQLWSTPVEGLRTRLLAEHFAARLASQIGSGNNRTWGKILGGLVSGMQAEDVLWLDQVALRAAGIEANIRPRQTSSTEFEVDDTATGMEQRVRKLAGHGLAIVVSPSRIIVTTSDRVAHWSEDLRPTATPRVYAVDSEHLIFELESNPEQMEGGIVSVAQWTATLAPPALPWNTLIGNSMSDVGHRACTIEFIDELPSVVVRRAYVQQGLWYVVWLAAVVVGMCWLVRRIDWLVLVLATAAAICMVVPPHWLTIPQATLVGILSAVILRLVLTGGARVTHDQSTQAILVRGTPAIILLCALLWGTGAAGAPRPNEQSVTTRENVPQVLVPIDNKGKLDGKDVYVPDTFLTALESASRTDGLSGTRYVLRDAIVRGNIPGKTQEHPESADPWTISLEIECFEPRCEIELPLQQSDGAWLDDSCVLDGKIVPLLWQSEGKGCRIVVLGVGTHQLELKLRPIHNATAEKSHVQLHIPRLPGTVMELAVPASVENLRIPGAGRLQTKEPTGILRTVLSPGKMVQLDWTHSGKPQSADSDSDVDQLSWLHVEQSAARLEVRLQFRGSTPPPRNLRLEVPEQLKLLPPDELSLVEKIISQGDTSKEVRLRLKSGLGPNARVSLVFQLQRTASLGRIFFPSVRLKGITPTRTLFATSVGPGLSYQEESSDLSRKISPSEFSTEWGDVDSPPLFAYSLAENGPQWSLRVWPDPETFSAQQSMRLACRMNGLRVEYNAAVNQIVGNCLIHEIQVPDDLEIDQITVSLQEETEPLPIRWSRSDASRVTVFFGRPIDLPHLISLQGKIPAEPDGTVAVPRIVLRGADRGEIRMDLYRDPRVLVSWVDPRAVPQETRQHSVSRSSSDILLGQYAWRANEPHGEQQLRLQKNERQFTADTVTTIEQNEQGRTATLLAHIEVSQGVVGQMQLSVPSHVHEPYVVQPASAGVVGEMVDSASGRQVTLLLNQPVVAGQSLDVQFSGRLTSPADGVLAIPNLAVNTATVGRNYVMLPTRLGDRAMEWRTAGLRREPLPEELRHALPLEADRLTYRVVSRRFFAQEPAYRGNLRNAALRRVWIDGLIDAHGSLAATATFVVQPGRATHCSVRVPFGARLTQLVVDDMPARRQLSGGAWRIPLGPPLLPRVVKVTYLIASEHLDKKMQLVPPEVLIGDAALPIEDISWKLRPLGGLRIKPTKTNSESSSKAEFDARYRCLAETLEDSVPLAAEMSMEEVRPWYRAWLTHIQSTREQTSLGHASIAELALLQEEFSYDERPLQWSELFKGVETSETASPISIPPECPPNLPERPASSLSTETVVLAGNSAGGLEIGCSQTVVSNPWRWVAALAVLAAGVWLGRNLGAESTWIFTLCQWPHALATGMGIVWWSLLTPSVMGLFIVVLALISLALTEWRKHHQPPVTNISTQLTARVS